MEHKLYSPKPIIIEAVVYDETEEMAQEIEMRCKRSWAEYDLGGSFCGLRAYTKDNIKNSRSTYVEGGDYLVWINNGYVLVRKDDFEKQFEII